MKALILTFLLVISWHIGFSQNRAIDSLKHELAIAKVDTSRALIMADIADYYKFSNPDSSLIYAQQVLTLARKIKFPNGEFRGYNNMGFAFGTIGNYPRALEMQLKALRMAEKHGFWNGKAEVLLSLANSYRSAEDYPKSLVHLKQSRQIYDSLQVYDMSTLTLSGTARIYWLMNQLDSAQHYAEMCYENINQYNLEWLRCVNLLGLGRIQQRKENYQLALDYFRKSVTYNSVGNYIYTSQSYLEMARIFQKTNQPDSSVFYANKSLANAQQANLYDKIVESSLFLAGLYEKKDALLTIQFYQIAVAAQEKLTKFGSVNAMQNQIAFNEEERQYEIEMAKTAWRNQVRQHALLTGLGLFLLIAFFLYRNNRQKQTANTVLQEQKEKVENTLVQLQSTQTQLIQSEKLASLGELTAGIAHEIQNPLNFVNNFAEVSAEMLVEMHEELIKGDTTEAITIATDLKTNLEKINHHGQRASSIVKGMLEHSRVSTGVKEPTDINALADEFLRLAYHGLRAKDNNFNATMETHFDPELPLVSVIPQDIGRVLLNLINNAFYALNERQKQMAKVEPGPPLSESFRLSESYTPTISLRTKGLDNALEIRIKDNGNGIPEPIRDKIFQPFFTTKPTGQGTGLGLSLAYDIVTKGHGGSLEVLSNEGVGSEFILTLPFKTNG